MGVKIFYHADSVLRVVELNAFVLLSQENSRLTPGFKIATSHDGKQTLLRGSRVSTRSRMNRDQFSKALIIVIWCLYLKDAKKR